MVAETQNQAALLLGHALDLPIEDRSYIATKLFASLDGEPELSPAWQAKHPMAHAK